MKTLFFVTVSAVALFSSFVASAAEAGTTTTCRPPAVLAKCGCVVPPRPVARRAPVRQARATPVRVQTRTVYRDRVVAAPAPAPQIVERVVQAPAQQQMQVMQFSSIQWGQSADYSRMIGDHTTYVGGPMQAPASSLALDMSTTTSNIVWGGGQTPVTPSPTPTDQFNLDTRTPVSNIVVDTRNVDLRPTLGGGGLTPIIGGGDVNLRPTLGGGSLTPTVVGGGSNNVDLRPNFNGNGGNNSSVTFNSNGSNGVTSLQPTLNGNGGNNSSVTSLTPTTTIVVNNGGNPFLVGTIGN